MRPEYEIFHRYAPKLSRLKAYGFTLSGGEYIFSKKLTPDFKAQVSVDKEGNVTGKVIDLDLDEEYTNIYAEQYGAFVSQIREAYITLLEEIRDKCFEKRSFIFPQTLRIVDYIYKQYHDKAEYVFSRYPDYAVFRNKDSEKWYGIIMNIDGKKLGREKGEVEILDVKADPKMISELLKVDGFHEAYHMNKEKWLTLRLDDSIDDEIIFSLLDNSYAFTAQADAWLVPANPKYYDVIGEFDRHEAINWKQSSDVRVGDIVYLYVGQPYSAILYKCIAEEVNIPYDYKDKNLSINRLMKIRRLKKYPADRYPYAYLNSIGIRMVRGPLRLKKEIVEKLD